MTEEEFKKNAKTIPTNIETEEKIALDYFKYKVLPTTNGTAFESKEEHYTKMVLNVIEKLKKENEELKEKNKTLELVNTLRSYCKIDELANDFNYYKNLANAYQANSISKDKIRDFIKRLEKDVENIREKKKR